VARRSYVGVSENGEYEERLLKKQKSVELLNYEFCNECRTTRELDTAFIVPGCYGNGYFHIIQNILPTLTIYKDLNLDCPIILPLFDYERFPAVREALVLVRDRLGIGKNQIIEGDAVTDLKVRHAIAPETIPASLYVWRFWNALFDAIPILPEGPSPERIYITRGGVGRRPIVNESEVEKFLAARGISVIKPEELSFAKQAAIFRNASLIVAPHGAGLVHLNFCREGTRVIELATKPWHRSFPDICTIARLEYIPVMPEVMPKQREVSWEFKKFQVSLNKIDGVLSELGYV
jgi:capsular polysaccharide biosynthesis protein